MLTVLFSVTSGCGGGGSQPLPDGSSGRLPGGDKVAPRWERVGRYSGTGEQRAGRFEIDPAAQQWRVKASCEGSGRLRVVSAGEDDPLVDTSCPASEFGFSIHTGANVVDVAAPGPWKLVVDQQLDTPIAEPRLAGMEVTNRLASGALYGIEQEGHGTATLYRLPGGRRAIRFDPFSMTDNTDLVVWASTARTPKTSAAALHAPHVEIAELKATAGPQNYLVPDDVPDSFLRSIVIWCVPVRVAYSAATLRR